MATLIINNVQYANVPEIDVPTVDSTIAKFFDTSSSDVNAADILNGKIGFNAAGSVTGSMPNNGSVGGTISTKTGLVNIPAGYTTGGSVYIATAEQNKLVPSNIKSGVTLMGVQGSLTAPTVTQDNTTKILSIS